MRCGPHSPDQLPLAELTSKRMHDVLDLLPRVQGMQRRECPANVDMAKIKYEFLAHYQAQAWRAAALADVCPYRNAESLQGSRFAPVSGG